MNIFYLHDHPFFAAVYQTDPHIVKMPLESMQLLSTAARLTVGTDRKFVDPVGNEHIVNVLEGETIDFCDVVYLYYAGGYRKRTKLYWDSKIPKGVIDIEFIQCKPFYEPENQRALAITHQNHPCAIWVRESRQNFDWLVEHTLSLEVVWKIRYRHPVWKRHKSVRLLDVMPEPDLPDNGFTQPALAMPYVYKMEGDPVRSYWNYYRSEKI